MKHMTEPGQSGKISHSASEGLPENLHLVKVLSRGLGRRERVSGPCRNPCQYGCLSYPPIPYLGRHHRHPCRHLAPYPLSLLHYHLP